MPRPECLNKPYIGRTEYGGTRSFAIKRELIVYSGRGVKYASIGFWNLGVSKKWAVKAGSIKKSVGVEKTLHAGGFLCFNANVLLPMARRIKPPVR